METIKVVAFDCDGVMFDTLNTNRIYYDHILNHFNRPGMTQKQLDYVHMHTAEEAIARLFEDEENIEAVKNYYNNLSYVPFLKYMEIEPFLLPLLKSLKGRYKTAVATNRTNTMSYVLSEHNLEECFDIVVTALDVDRPKPHPDSIEKVIRHFDIEPVNMIYIGDSKLDELAAKAAGVLFVAYNNSSLSADFHITRLIEIENILD